MLDFQPTTNGINSSLWPCFTLTLNDIKISIIIECIAAIKYRCAPFRNLGDKHCNGFRHHFPHISINRPQHIFYKWHLLKRSKPDTIYWFIYVIFVHLNPPVSLSTINQYPGFSSVTGLISIADTSRLLWICRLGVWLCHGNLLLSLVTFHHVILLGGHFIRKAKQESQAETVYFFLCFYPLNCTKYESRSCTFYFGGE